MSDEITVVENSESDIATVLSWVDKAYKTDHNRRYLRLGQWFINNLCYATYVNTALYYCEEEGRAHRMIYQILKEHSALHRVLTEAQRIYWHNLSRKG